MPRHPPLPTGPAAGVRAAEDALGGTYANALVGDSFLLAAPHADSDPERRRVYRFSPGSEALTELDPLARPERDVPLVAQGGSAFLIGSADAPTNQIRLLAR